LDEENSDKSEGIEPEGDSTAGNEQKNPSKENMPYLFSTQALLITVIIVFLLVISLGALAYNNYKANSQVDLTSPTATAVPSINFKTITPSPSPSPSITVSASASATASAPVSSSATLTSSTSI